MSDAQGAAPASAPAAQSPANAETTQQQGAGAPGTAGGQAGTPANPIKDAAQEAMRKHRLKVDGQEIEVDDEELKRGYGHQKAANKILQEGRAARKQAEQFIAMMKDPDKVEEILEKLGHKPRELFEKRLAQKLQDELMDPRDKELRDAKAKLAKIDEMEKQQKEAVEKQRFDEMKKKYANSYNEQFTAAIKEAGLPPNKAMVGEMAKYISRATKIGFEMTPKEAAQLVKEDIQRLHLSVVGESDGETLLRLLGDEAAAKILTARGSKVKSPEDILKTPEKQGELGQRTRNTNQRMTHREWRNYNRR